MTELEALRRVAEAARAFFDAAEYDTNMSGGDWGERMGPLARAMEYAFGDLDALPAPAAEPAGEVVEVAVWVDPVDGDVQLARPGGKMDQMRLRFADWICLGIARLPVRIPLPRVPEVVGEVG